MRRAQTSETSSPHRQTHPAAAVRAALSGCGFSLMIALTALLFSGHAQAENLLEGYEIVDSRITISSGGTAGAFVTGLEDVPLMPDLQDVPEAAVIFDKPAGRLIEAYAEGNVEPAAVLGFYRDTLPQLGWSLEAVEGATGVFLRERERLEIHVLEGQDRRTVRFVLSPK
ncbi:hypothetical protein [Denitrobaculum tricleocarpae]|uniref:Uncharacterized protein n=1 Tax=Denitrobaculum tricleocarpae TaxID=2591009 RepID=A0A545TGJ0_9PROT|nr:hypothetical protein [Denitrobaculum tricleocarpae]TQV76349.1 hypothetical protein FKG95_22230 [Denitrobaculum tricleocarpae]